MKRYETYKDSGIEWIGEIPGHWEVKKLKYVLDSSLKYGANEIAESENANHPRYIRITDFGSDGVLRHDTFKSLPPEKAKEYLLNDGDILFARSGATVGKTFQFKNYKGEACFAGYLIKATPKSGKIVSDYLYLFTQTVNYENWKDSIFNQATIQNIGADKYSILELTVPPISEQTAIAHYLDRKTAAIDKLIADKKRLLELYEEEKTAIINQAVTKGINPDAPMKDSGIEWLGEIPEHWEVKRFKYYFNLITEKVEDDLPKIGLENIESKSGKFIETDSDFAGQGIRFRPKDILFGKLRPYLAKVWLADFDGQAVGDFYVFRSKQEVNPEFAKYRILDSSFIEVINSSTYGSKMPRVSWEFIADLPIAFPKIQEQASIVRHIETECALIDAKKSKTEKLIELLTEYRTALISEVVTGKIKVVP